MTTQPERRRPIGSAPPGASDVELLRAVAAGNEAAFAELRDRYGRAVQRVCRSVAGAKREDCEQEVFARIWRKAQLYDPARGSAAAWLLTVARRTALNLGAARRPPLPIEDPDAVGEPPAELDAFWLQAGLAQLPERERTVIELAYYDDLSENAIARRLRVPLGSVKSWKRRGLNRLATALSDRPLPTTRPDRLPPRPRPGPTPPRNLPAQSDRHGQRAALGGRARDRPLGARTVVGRQGRSRVDACRGDVAARDQRRSRAARTPKRANRRRSGQRIAAHPLRALPDGTESVDSDISIGRYIRGDACVHR